MAPPPKKLILILLIILGALGTIFWREMVITKNITTTSQREPLISAAAFDFPLAADEPILGNPGAPLAIVEFIDLSDAKQRQIHLALTNFVSAHPQSARLYFKHFPKNQLWGNSNLALHQAAYCAGEQKKLWEFIDAFAGAPKQTDAGALVAIAQTSQLDLPKWRQCLTAPLTREKIAGDAETAKNIGFRSPPLLFVNNHRINFDEKIDLQEMLAGFIAP